LILSLAGDEAVKMVTGDPGNLDTLTLIFQVDHVASRIE
jgi:hypothetical protein